MLKKHPLMLIAAALLVAIGCHATAQMENEDKKVRLSALYKAYQAYEVFNGAPANTIDDLALAKGDVAELKGWLNLDELGLSLVNAQKEVLHKIVMAYEKEVPKIGGLVMYYDGSVKTLSAEAASKLVGIGGHGPAQEPSAKTDALANEAVVRFFKAFKAKDVEGLMKEVDVPFCREGGKNIEKRDELAQFFQSALNVRVPSKDTIAVKLVTTLPELEKSGGKFTDDERKAAEEVLGKDHRVVEVEWNRAGEGKHRTLILIRLQKGKAKVIGII